ncbi:hypothetical protein Tco_0807917 [Tanacetum coccineum]
MPLLSRRIVMSSLHHPSFPSNYDVEDAFSLQCSYYTYDFIGLFRGFLSPEVICTTKETKLPVESPIPVSPSSSVGSSSSVRSTTPPPDYPFDESFFAELLTHLWIIP